MAHRRYHRRCLEWGVVLHRYRLRRVDCGLCTQHERRGCVLDAVVGQLTTAAGSSGSVSTGMQGACPQEKTGNQIQSSSPTKHYLEILPSFVHMLTTRGNRRVLSNECTRRSLLQDGSLCMQSPMCLLHMSRAKRALVTPLEHDISACAMTSSNSHARTHVASKTAFSSDAASSRSTQAHHGRKKCMRTLLNKLAH